MRGCFIQSFFTWNVFRIKPKLRSVCFSYCFVFEPYMHAMHIFLFSSNQDQGELGNLVRGLVSTQAAWYFQKATWLKTTSWPRQNHCSLLGTERRLGSFESQT